MAMKGRAVRSGPRPIASDITERKQQEKQKILSLKVLGRLNHGGDQRELIRDVLSLVKEFSGCESVGIRLKEGEDFPYYRTSGFPDEHVLLENSLCTRDLDGRLVRDEVGKPVLECMCGNIICGRFDPQKPFFTDGGSFWTNSTTELLASTTEEDRQARTRDRCNGEGYESVALIPLKFQGGNVGLLQLNDRRRNCFTPQLIEYYEGIGQSVGIILARQRAEEMLRENRDRLEEIVRERTTELETINKLLQQEITERKQAEKKIVTSLKEKETLLREIHHRVKNNLQVVSSLLYLQSEHIKDEQILDILRESQNRIKAMAFVHEQLYQSRDLEAVDFAQYIQSLSAYLFDSHGVSPDAIDMKPNVKDIKLDIDVAIPCGLIVNELVSNSLGHAFPSGEACSERQAEVRVDLRADGDKFTLTVSDNGVGLPKDLDFRNTESLGLRLVMTLTRQLEGTIELDRSAGTRFEITFTRP